MRTPELDTISIFSKDIALNLTINQISKELGKSYAFTNKYIREYIDEGILTKKIVGSAILCSLNFSNEKTLGLLMLNSIEEKSTFLQKADKSLLARINKLRKTPGLQSLFISNKKIHIICDDKKTACDFLGLESKSVSLIDENEFKLTFRSIDYEKNVILEGYERFWKLIAQMFE